MFERDVILALKQRFAPPAYCFLSHVANGTGGHASRKADAVAMSVWPSRGLELIGFEVKVSKSDWKKELETPAKAEAVCQYCDRWYVATIPGIVDRTELPSAWGLIEADGKKTKIVVQAPTLESKTITRTFLAELLRKSVEQSVDVSVVEEARKAGYAKGMEDGARKDNWRLKYLEELEARVKDFEAGSGIQLGQWRSWQNPKAIGKAVAALLSREPPADRLTRVAGDLSKIVDGLRAVAEACGSVEVPV